MPDVTDGMCYAVVLIGSGQPVYGGRSLALAAQALEPGTTYGKSYGCRADLALAEAQGRASFFRRGGRQ